MAVLQDTVAETLNNKRVAEKVHLRLLAARVSVFDPEVNLASRRISSSERLTP